MKEQTATFTLIYINENFKSLYHNFSFAINNCFPKLVLMGNKNLKKWILQINQNTSKTAKIKSLLI